MGCLPPFGSLTLYPSRERSGPKIRARSAEIPGSQREPAALASQLLGTASSGGGDRSSAVRVACPTLNGPLHAHRTLKGTAATFTQSSAIPGCCLQTKGFPKKDVNDLGSRSLVW